MVAVCRAGMAVFEFVAEWAKVDCLTIQPVAAVVPRCRLRVVAGEFPGERVRDEASPRPRSGRVLDETLGRRTLGD